MSSNSNSTQSSDDRVRANKGRGKRADEQVKLPKVLDYLFEKELINKQNKHIHIMDTFGPSRKPQYLSTKFYARHEQELLESAAAFVPFAFRSTCKQDTEAAVYGWMPEIVSRRNLLNQLNIVSAPKQKCCLTTFGEKLDCDKANARPPFNGLRFFLQ